MAAQDAARHAEMDRRFMAAAIRLSRRHLGLTATNPSVATLIVRDGKITKYRVNTRITFVVGEDD